MDRPLSQIADELWTKNSVYLDTQEGDCLVASIEKARLRLVELVIKPEPGKNVPPLGFIQLVHQGNGTYEIFGQGFRYRDLTNGIHYGMAVASREKCRGIGSALVTLGIESVKRFHKEEGRDTPIKITAEATAKSRGFYEEYGFNIEEAPTRFEGVKNIFVNLQDPIPVKPIRIK